MVQVDVLVAEQTKAADLTGLIVMPPALRELTARSMWKSSNSLTDGRGSGTWNRLSPLIPALIKAAIKNKKVYKFAKDKVSLRGYPQSLNLPLHVTHTNY